MNNKKFAIFGTGFWANYQLSAWKEVEGAECVALYNRTLGKAQALAERHGIPAVYDDPEELLNNHLVDFVDIITDVDSHERLVLLCAEHGVAAICQKPMSSTLKSSRRMVEKCAESNVSLLIHENWRWQEPIRRYAALLRTGVIGKPYHARIEMTTCFPVFDNQPFLKSLDQFILTDIGSHILDTARFLFGEATQVYCRTHRVHGDIAGEDVATVVLAMESGATVVCEMAYVLAPKEHDRFPETYIVTEGEQGCLELGPDFVIKATNVGGTHAKRYPPQLYPWADPAYAIVHASIVDCNRDLLAGLCGAKVSETTATDNLKTVELVHGSYESARTHRAVDLR